MEMFFILFGLLAVEKLFERFGANDVAFFGAEPRIFEIEMELGRCELILQSGVLHAHAARGPRLERRTHLVSIKADLFTRRAADAASEPTTITEMDRDDSVGLARHDPEWSANCLPVLVRDIDKRNVMFATFYGAAVVPVGCELLSGAGTDDRDVVPRDFRQRLRQLL